MIFDFGIEDVRPITGEESGDGEGWDIGIVFGCGCILETEDAFNSLQRHCSEEHLDIWMGVS